MATITKTPSGTWKVVIRRVGWPTAAKTFTFRVKRDAEGWARRTEDEMIRGVFIQRSPSEKMLVSTALDRYAKEVVPTKKESTQRREGARIKELTAYFGQYSLAAVTPDLVAKFRDMRIAKGKANNSVRLELALLGHLFNVAIKEWHIGLAYNPVANIRKPSPGAGRDRRLTKEEQKRLLAAVDEHSNPMLGWIVRIAIGTGMRHSEILELRR
jgi:integrase